MAAAPTAGEPPRSGARRLLTPRVVLAALAVLLVAAMALDTTWKKGPVKVTASGREAFSAAKYGRETFPKVSAAITKSAVPLPTLVAALRKDQDAAGKQYGHREGSSPPAFPTSGEGVAGKVENGLMELEVDGVPKSTRVSVQVGPALNGTALRDGTGTIHFGQFVNQVDYASAATALNNEVKTRVLKGFDADAARGKRVKFTGAFALLTPAVITITPVQLEVAG
jgi:predicted lipoprotein